jgi:hypothetical protein
VSRITSIALGALFGEKAIEIGGTSPDRLAMCESAIGSGKWGYDSAVSRVEACNEQCGMVNWKRSNISTVSSAQFVRLL